MRRRMSTCTIRRQPPSCPTMGTAAAIGIVLAGLLVLAGCATPPIAAEPAPARPPGCPRSPVALKVVGDDNELRLWYLDQLRRRNVAVDPDARTTVQIEEPDLVDRGSEGCLVLAAWVTCDGQSFSARKVEATRCYPGTVDGGARAFFGLAGLVAGIATGRNVQLPPYPEDAPIITLRAELVDRITSASR